MEKHAYFLEIEKITHYGRDLEVQRFAKPRPNLDIV